MAKMATMPVLIWLAVPMMLLSTAAAIAEERLRGLKLSEAFADSQVAALVAAARAGNDEEASAAVTKGADVNYRGAQGITPLMWAVAAGDMEAASILLKLNADPNIKSIKNASAMSLAVAEGSTRMVELLLKNGGDPNLRGPDNDPLLHIAALKQRKDQIDVLLANGADINGHSNRGDSTAANMAAAVGRFDLAVYLLERGLSGDGNLRRLGASAEVIVVPKHSEQHNWKERLITMLKERGVTFPVVTPRKVGPPLRVIERERQRRELQESQK